MKYYVQQMMLGSLCTSEEKAKELLKEIKRSGYSGLEMNRYMIHPTSFLVRALTKLAGMPSGNAGKYNWSKLIKEEGLDVISLHTDLGSLENDYEGVIKDAKDFNTSYIVITGMYRFNYQDLNEVKKLAQRLNVVGERLRKDGFKLLYHNHNIELLKVDEINRAYDILVNETNSENVNFELDTYWFSEAGADVKKIIKTLNKRLKLWHITDRGTRLEKTSITPIVKSDSVELGAGNMDLNGIYDISKDYIDAIILETHRNFINGSPLDSLKISGRYLLNNFGEK